MQQLLLCTVCDATHPAVIAEHGTDAKERDCVADWLKGVQLTTERATCFCWEDDPYPIANFPQVSNGERRFHHYFTIAKILKVSGTKNRAKLSLLALAPSCRHTLMTRLIICITTARRTPCTTPNI